MVKKIENRGFYGLSYEGKIIIPPIYLNIEIYRNKNKMNIDIHYFNDSDKGMIIVHDENFTHLRVDSFLPF